MTTPCRDANTPQTKQWLEGRFPTFEDVDAAAPGDDDEDGCEFDGRH
jgi:hypothetical protein